LGIGDWGIGIGDWGLGITTGTEPRHWKNHYDCLKNPKTPCLS
jgi:hypothetical protein